MSRTVRLFCIYLLATSFSIAFAQQPPPSAELPRGELKQGRYVGWINLQDRNERVAVVAEFFLESPEDLKSFPRLNASLRLNLGGYNTHEYITETFKDLKYDFDNGHLTFDESKNDLLLTTKVYKKNGRAKIMGQVFVRSSATTGSIDLTEESDEPGDDDEDLHSPTTAEDTSPFIPLLDGQYEGKCDERDAAFQIHTVRGLQSIDASESKGLERNYGITARLVFKNDNLCGKLPKDRWCTRFHFEKGSYNFYRGKLNLKGEQSTDNCDIKGGEITCRIRTFEKSLTCKLKKRLEPTANARFFKRRYHISPSEEHKEELPQPKPPLNEALAEALRGAFYGYAHNEMNDSYLPLRLDVISYSSTDNPHNPNQMMVSSTASIYLGGFGSDSAATQRYEPRSFYIRPGFILAGPNADSFIAVTEWKKGFIRGTLYSHAYGRIGSVQLIKGAPPSLPNDATMIQTFAGEFTRKLGRSGPSQWIRFIFPVQPDDLNGNVIRFSGSYQSAVGNTPIRDMDGGAFDLYTGRMGWLIVRDDVSTFGSGKIGADGAAYLFWPPNPIFGVVANSYVYERFDREK